MRGPRRAWRAEHPGGRVHARARPHRAAQHLLHAPHLLQGHNAARRGRGVQRVRDVVVTDPGTRSRPDVVTRRSADARDGFVDP